MTSDKLREVLRTEPFQPFVIHMADGRALPVTHPELMAISPSGRIAYLFETGARQDSGHHIDILMITSIEVQAARPGTGRGRRRKAG
jgi:hypothetical protein